MQYDCGSVTNQMKSTPEACTQMAKADIVQQNLAEYVVMPDEVEFSFKLWWDSVPT